MALAEEPHKTYDTILVLDFGSQYSHLITRRLRELNVYSEMLPCTQKLSDLDWTPKGIILSGGPYSVYAEGAPHVDPAVFDAGVPILGICYGLQEIAWHFGKNVSAGEKREYGHADIIIENVQEKSAHINHLFAGLGSEVKVWMSHGDKLSHAPPAFVVIAKTENAPFAGIAHEEKPYYGIQFHPEVTHSDKGAELFQNFAVRICKARQDWTMGKFVDLEIARIRALVGEKGQVIGAVSGGVDSTVAAKLMKEAIGDRFHAVMVDNGLLRVVQGVGEAEIVKKTLDIDLGINLTVVDAKDLFLTRLAGVSEPEQKRKIIGNTFIDVFLKKAKEIEEAAKDTPQAGNIEWLLQGTLYPDVIESISFKGPSATIKSHHNVGGLPAKMDLKLIEPLRELFKDEVRLLGVELGISKDNVGRHPFPGPGLGIRIIGDVTAARVATLQKADDIYIQEIRKAGVYDKIGQAFAALLPGANAVGVMGDNRVYGPIIMLRAVESTDFMTANIYHFEPKFYDRVSSRIINEVDGVTRVGYDLTSKPPGTIEFE